MVPEFLLIFVVYACYILLSCLYMLVTFCYFYMPLFLHSISHYTCSSHPLCVGMLSSHRSLFAVFLIILPDIDLMILSPIHYL